jgi:hypothetical protein
LALVTIALWRRGEAETAAARRRIAGLP